MKTTTSMGTAQTDGYLARIGAERPRQPNAAALAELHLRHLQAVPFENLSIHLGEDLSLEEKALYDKVVQARRGGFCYELNGLFAALLTSLGYRVTYLAARVHTAGGLGIPFDHLALCVRPADGSGPWLVDVGFGDHSHHPLRLDALDSDQSDPAGVFRITAAPDGDLDVLRDGTPRYRLETRPRALTDFEAGCWWHRTSPKSGFVAKGPVCSVLAPGGRHTLSGRSLITTTTTGHRQERMLATDAELLSAYHDVFGITLDRIPAARP
ncbi:arylamine N-acetyltransferase family protein [Streptomyces sp. NPDC003393]